MAGKYTQEQLESFIANPETVDATDTELIEALASAELASLGVTESDRTELGLDTPKGEAEDEEAKKIAAEAIAEAEKVAAEEAAAEAAKKAKADEATAPKSDEGRVLTKDGKNTLPFEVLKDARERAAGAESALAEASQSLLALQARVRALEAGKADPGRGEEKTADELEEALVALAGDAPWSEGPMGKIVGAVRVMQEKLAGYEQEREESEDQAAEKLQAAANQALEGNATLVLWKSQAPDLYSEAVSFDRQLRTDPVQARRFDTFDRRFAHCVRLVVANHEGETIPLPAPITPSKPATTPSAADIKQRAALALAKAEDATAVRTLTDVPGGEGEVTAEEQLQRMSPMDLAAKFANMTPQQVVDFTMTH